VAFGLAQLGYRGRPAMTYTATTSPVTTSPGTTSPGTTSLGTTSLGTTYLAPTSDAVSAALAELGLVAPDTAADVRVLRLDTFDGRLDAAGVELVASRRGSRREWVVQVSDGRSPPVDVVLRSLPRKGTDGRYVAVVQGAIRSLDVPPDLRRRRGRRGAVNPGDEDRVEVQLEVAAVFIRDAILDALGVRGA